MKKSLKQKKEKGTAPAPAGIGVTIKVNLSEIKPNPENPRIIKDDKFKKLVQSLKDFPEMLELRPVVVNADMVVLGGNMRLRAAEAAGLKEIPVLVADKLTKEQEREFIIKDNSSFGEWDWDILANQWDEQELKDWGLDIPLSFNPSGEASEDDFEIPDEIKTDIMRGDIFDIGHHRLICGDSGNVEDLSKLMSGEKSDMVFSDPPYGVSIGKKNRMLNSVQKAGRNLKDIKDDEASPDELHAILLPAFVNLRENSKEDCTYFITAPQGGGIGMMMMMMRDAGLPVRHVLIWKKNAPTFSMGRLDYDYKHEPILLTWTKKHNFYGAGSQKTSVWEFDKPRSSKEHPTMKPVELIGNAILNNSKENDLIVDIFLGSGSTMVASHQLGRICYGAEIDPHYCQVIIDRMLKLDSGLIVKKNGKEIYQKVEA